MAQIRTNARTTIRVTAPDGTDVQPWTIEFVPSDPDLVRLYSVDDQPEVIIVETSDREGTLTLECFLGLHGMNREGDKGPQMRLTGELAGSLDLEIRSGISDPGELSFDLR